TIVFDITLYDLDGNKIIDIKEFVMKKLERSDTLSHSVKSEKFHQEIKIEGSHNPVNPKSTGNKIHQLGQKEGILPLEGARVFNVILEDAKHPQYIVVSQDLKVLFENMGKTDEGRNSGSDEQQPGESIR